MSRGSFLDGTVEPHTGWWRLNHEGLRLPAPSVFLPAEDLYQGDLAQLGFLSALDTMSGDNPVATSRNITGDVSDPDRLNLMVSRRALFEWGDPQVVIREDADTKFISGLYTEPADRTWQRQSQKMQLIILIAGPRPAQPGTVAAATPQEWLLTNETLFGLMTNPTTMMARVALATRL